MDIFFKIKLSVLYIKRHNALLLSCTALLAAITQSLDEAVWQRYTWCRRKHNIAKPYIGELKPSKSPHLEAT